MSATGIIQAAATIAKTTQTIMGSELPTENVECFRLFLDYVKGDETGVDVIMNLRRIIGGTSYQNKEWTSTAGVNASVVEKIRLTASGNYSFAWTYPCADYIYFTQGGSNNDGTPTGTLAASYTTE